MKTIVTILVLICIITFGIALGSITSDAMQVMSFGPPNLPIKVWAELIVILITSAAFVGVCTRAIAGMDRPWFASLLMCAYALSIMLYFGHIYVQTGLVEGENKAINDPASCLYFSAVTFTTVGYGDIHPSRSARPIAAFEAFFGYLFLGIFAAVIVSLLSPRPFASADTRAKNDPPPAPK